MPERYSVEKLSINGQSVVYNVSEGYINIVLQKDVANVIELMIEPELNMEKGIIDGKKYVAFSYGCVLLAAKDIITGTSLKKERLHLERGYFSNNERLCFIGDGTCDGKDTSIVYCEYSAADDYSVWLPVE